jgi:hypothetical protein
MYQSPAYNLFFSINNYFSYLGEYYPNRITGFLSYCSAQQYILTIRVDPMLS